MENPTPEIKIIMNGLKIDYPTFIALKNFKKNNGRDWKFKLACAWADGAYENRYSCTDLEAGSLQRLRNRTDRMDESITKDGWLVTLKNKDWNFVHFMNPEVGMTACNLDPDSEKYLKQKQEDSRLICEVTCPDCITKMKINDLNKCSLCPAPCDMEAPTTSSDKIDSSKGFHDSPGSILEKKRTWKCNECGEEFPISTGHGHIKVSKR